jgi:hypothetical protein
LQRSSKPEKGNKEMKANKVEKSEYEYVLTLTHREAVVLHTLCRQVSGSKDGPRDVIDSFCDYLKSMGVNAKYLESRGTIFIGNGWDSWNDLEDAYGKGDWND